MFQETCNFLKCERIENYKFHIIIVVDLIHEANVTRYQDYNGVDEISWQRFHFIYQAKEMIT